MGGGGYADTKITLVGTKMTHETSSCYKGALYRVGGLLWNGRSIREIKN